MANIPIEQRPNPAWERVQRNNLRYKIIHARTLEDTKLALLHYIELRLQEIERDGIDKS